MSPPQGRVADATWPAPANRPRMPSLTPEQALQLAWNLLDDPHRIQRAQATAAVRQALRLTS